MEKRHIQGELRSTGSAESRAVTFRFSDGSVDRMGDTINPNGWKLDNFRRNPVALFAHNSDNPACVVGKVTEVSARAGALIGTIEFATVDINPVAESVFRMIKGGFLSAVSVGFLPLAWKLATDPARPGGLDFTSQDLMEISVCPVPANANALVLARAAGIDVLPIQGFAQSTATDADDRMPAQMKAMSFARLVKYGGLTATEAIMSREQRSAIAEARNARDRIRDEDARAPRRATQRFVRHEEKPRSITYYLGDLMRKWSKPAKSLIEDRRLQRERDLAVEHLCGLAVLPDPIENPKTCGEYMANAALSRAERMRKQ